MVRTDSGYFLNIFYGILTLEKVPKSRNIANFGIFLVQEIAWFWPIFSICDPKYRQISNVRRSMQHGNRYRTLWDKNQVASTLFSTPATRHKFKILIFFKFHEKAIIQYYDHLRFSKCSEMVRTDSKHVLDIFYSVQTLEKVHLRHPKVEIWSNLANPCLRKLPVFGQLASWLYFDFWAP